MTRLVSTASNGGLEVENPEGSFWKGNATALNYINNKKTFQRFEKLSWEIVPTQIFKGNIAFRIIITDHQLTADGIISAGLTGRSISDLRASLPADLVGNFIPDVKALSPRGNAEIKVPLLSLDPIQLKQPANILWKNAGLSISQVSPLGDYSLDLIPQKDSIGFNLQTIKGPLTIIGKGSYNNKTGGAFEGTGHADVVGQPQLASLLQLMGPVQNNRNVKLSYNFPAIKN